MKMWRSVELKMDKAVNYLKYKLHQNGIKFETSYNEGYIHFEVWCDDDETRLINHVLDSIVEDGLC